jgi:hypothetical protein
VHVKAGAYACSRQKLFPHHFCDEAGEAGPASVRACLIGIAALKGARGVVVMADEERQAIYSHLAGHLEDAGIDPPKLDGALRLVDELRLVSYDAEDAVARVRDLSASRENRGKSLSVDAKVASLEMASVVDEMTRLSRQLGLMADHVAPNDPVSRALTAWAAHQAMAATR